MSTRFKAYIGIEPAFRKDEAVTAVLTALCYEIGRSMEADQWTDLTKIGAAKPDEEMGPSTVYVWEASQDDLISRITGNAECTRSNVAASLESCMSKYNFSHLYWRIQDGRHGTETAQLSALVDSKVGKGPGSMCRMNIATFSYRYSSEVGSPYDSNVSSGRPSLYASSNRFGTSSRPEFSPCHQIDSLDSLLKASMGSDGGTAGTANTSEEVPADRCRK